MYKRQEFDIDLEVSDDMNENGVNSIVFTQFMIKVEQKFSIEIPDHLMDVYQLRTLKNVAEMIKKYQLEASDEEEAWKIL